MIMMHILIILQCILLNIRIKCDINPIYDKALNIIQLTMAFAIFTMVFYDLITNGG